MNYVKPSIKASETFNLNLSQVFCYRKCLKKNETCVLLEKWSKILAKKFSVETMIIKSNEYERLKEILLDEKQKLLLENIPEDTIISQYDKLFAKKIPKIKIEELLEQFSSSHVLSNDGVSSKLLMLYYV